MKINKFLLFCIILAGLAVYVSCRKLDREQNPSVSKDVTSRFFTDHPPNDSDVQALADLLKMKNEQTNFVSKIVNAVGYPRWNNTLSYSPSSGSNARTGTDDSLNFYFIPFVRDTQDVVNACLIIKTRGTDTSYKWLCDWQYKDTAYTGVTRRATAAFLMQIDKEVFGQQRKYHVTDTALFDSRTSAVSVNGTSVLGASAENRSAVVEICVTYQAPVNGWLSGCEPGSPCNPYQNVTQCTSITLADNLGGSNDINNGLGWVNTTPTGGGSTAGWTQPPPNSCALLGSGGREPELPPGCTEPYGTGWIPFDNGDDLAYNELGYHHLENWTVSSEDYGKIRYWRQNNIDTVGLDSCLRKIISKLINLNGDNVMGKILNKMERSIFEPGSIDKFKVRIETGLMDSTIVARNDSNSHNPGTGVHYARIKVNTIFLAKSTELGMAYTIMHELMHAYLRSLHYRYHYTLNPSLIQSLGYDSLFNSFVDSLLARNTRAGLLSYISGNYQLDHNYMAEYLLDIFAEALERFDSYSISNKRYYWFVAWGGLFKSRPMQMHWPNAYDSIPANRWPPRNPAPSDDSTRGLKYALTISRIDSIRKAVGAEDKGLPTALGRKKQPGGCY